MRSNKDALTKSLRSPAGLDAGLKCLICGYAAAQCGKAAPFRKANGFGEATPRIGGAASSRVRRLIGKA